jgi:hypothetical protein
MSTKGKTDTADAAAADIDIDINEEEHVATLTIPTKGAAPTDEVPKRVIDIGDLGEEDLKTLKKQDPFLYYSIPRALRNSTADLTTLSSQEFAHGRRACPSRIESSIVQRKSCVSFEVHTDLALEEFMDEATLVGNGAGVDFDTMFDQLLLRTSDNKWQQ